VTSQGPIISNMAGENVVASGPRPVGDARVGKGIETRARILAVAAKTIARGGIAALRVEEVAEAADVSPALLYYHFKSRSGLVNAAFEYASEKAPSTALRVASDGRSGYEALESALLAELDDRPSVRDYAIVWGEVSALAVFEDDLRPSVRRINHAWRATVAGAIERGIADGSIRSDIDSEEAAELLIVLVDGFSVRWLAGSLELTRARELMRRALEQVRAGRA
jgi:AcrR family transcriptional regulator